MLLSLTVPCITLGKSKNINQAFAVAMIKLSILIFTSNCSLGKKCLYLSQLEPHWTVT